ncbi:mediator of RNA polymerase II transcription subunit 9 [Lingula anatina]|uniref:Mediator of RNA polymerase II transcription subunit 9 n=1 Tax=Lingula anatina TaxID=7574 RepID=A0A1S3I573_LINAN|nr:mediator of RNA polymerase II transcription subunit 9 [Lingula anatina]|eukprot:XP_013393420.1 mediator of RNA polymerase II transcription subunit 9 [Lingula anatina]
MKSMASLSEDVNFLPIIYDIIKSIDKDSHDVGTKVNEFKVKLQKAKDQTEKLPGIEYSKEDQLKQLDILRKQLIQKTELLQKYKNLCNFDIPK